MKGTVFAAAASVALCVAGCNQKPSSQPPSAAASAGDTTAPDARALAARDALAKRLTTRLTEAMSSGGPAEAIPVCSEEAPRIAAEVSREHNLTIGRTSFKLRNPNNAPPGWARPLIETRPDGPQQVDLPDGATGVLLPITLQPQCLACHGPADQINEAVAAQLADFYPEDQATGFQAGDLRGWFWVEVPGE